MQLTNLAVMEINKIYQESCLETLKKMPDNFIDVIVTSPPYNKKSANRKPNKKDTWSNGNAAIKYATYDDDMDEFEYQDWQIKIINECLRVLKSTGSLFYNHKNRTINKGIITPYEWLLKTNAIIKQEVIWDRLMIVEVDKVRFYPKTERIYWLIKDRIQPNFNQEFAKFTEIWQIKPTQGKERNNHPAPFPIKLAERCIMASGNKNLLIYDPFMGSGTTAIAALNCKMNYIGSEISSEYCKIANNRIKFHLKQQTLF